MTVGQLLNTVTSRELSEWYVLADLEFWQKRLAAKDQPPLDIDTAIKALFSKAANQGGIVWQNKNPSANSSST